MIQRLALAVDSDKDVANLFLADTRRELQRGERVVNESVQAGYRRLDASALFGAKRARLLEGVQMTLNNLENVSLLTPQDGDVWDV